ncbi:peptidase domain-containing ABC transporter [Enterococcus gallinarum]|uniref:Peptide cleavage/export ABC transporter n=3 Tax=Enterococcus gallinarum TaxID=1353 RepID=A0ABD4HN48_ENTGA|nr:peptide cleavage/export ABC transporter [Enterococcus gallinarum]MBA0948318.1 peptide cleavage/export ABC transporter [Enterococcus gallinarum]MBA0961349.1 peptide cleavage/export ABC transporter [Enterococcus gallinarum]MBA0972529.1 peptide cleavage/export ABC transporter [Enterococcus gallinarum]NVJ37227.1 peptide cleavage/export ABC transporter [Enterococcus gallinarum]
MKIFLQENQKDCGVACLRMIFSHYHSIIPAHKIEEAAGTDFLGTSARGIKQCAEKYNFICDVVRSNNISIFEENDFPFPVIAHINSKNGYPHYIVIHKIRKKHLYIIDPAVGKQKIDVLDFEKMWTGILFCISPNEVYFPKKERMENLFSFVPDLLKQKVVILSIVVSSFILFILGVFTSYYFQLLLDSIVPSKNFTGLKVLSIALLNAYFFQGVLFYVKGLLTIFLGQRLGEILILRYIKHILSLPVNFFENKNVGDIVSRFLDSSKIVDAVANVTLTIFIEGILIIAVSVSLILYNKTLFIIILLSVPLYIFVIFFSMKKYEIASKKEFEMEARINSEIIEMIKGIETVKAYGVENLIYKRIKDKYTKFLKLSFRTSKIDYFLFSSKQVIQLVTSGTILWIGTYHVIDGDITVGQLIMYNSLLMFIAEPIQSVINLQSKIQKAQVANNRLNEFLYLKPEYLEERTDTSIHPIVYNKNFRIQLSSVFFSYSNNTKILENISSLIGFGEKIAIIGKSGSGKSTLAKLLVRFYDPTQGRILIDGKDISNIDRREIRNIITYVPQDSFFFRGTIKDNLILGLSEIPDENYIEKICKIVNIHGFISKQPLKYKTMLEEDASNLSGGQRQRLAIARALLRGTNILILDEATSNMDIFLQNNVVSNLLKMKNRIVIFITHSLSIAKRCDKILIIDNGEIIKQGKHEELLKTEVYRSYFE